MLRGDSTSAPLRLRRLGLSPGVCVSVVVFEHCSESEPRYLSQSTREWMQTWDEHALAILARNRKGWKGAPVEGSRDADLGRNRWHPRVHALRVITRALPLCVLDEASGVTKVALEKGTKAPTFLKVKSVHTNGIRGSGRGRNALKFPSK